MKKWVIAICCSIGMILSASAELYSTSFEPAEGWATGSLGTNPGEQPPGGSWDNTGIAQVQDALPRTGDYSVYFNSENIGNHTALFTPTNAYSEYGAVTVSYYVYLPEYPNADGDSQVSADNNHRLELVTDETTLVLQWDNFDTAGNPGRQRTWIQSGLGAGGEPGVINQAWAPGEWTFVSFTLDFENDTYSYRVDSPTQGSNEVDGQPIDHDIGELQGVNLIHRDVGAALDLTMYVDDFEVIAGAPPPPPTPLYSTGFETAEGWATGSLGTNPSEQPPGGTWDNTGIAQVRDDLPRAGDYSVYFNSENIGNHTASFTPTNAYSDFGAVTVSYYVYLPAYPYADGDSQLANDNNHRLELVTDATTLRLQLDNFGTEGLPERHRSYISSGLGSGGEDGLMNFVWATGEWTHVEFTLDFDDNTYSYSIGSPTRGVNTISDQVIDHEINELQGVNLIHRDVGTALDLTMYVDDFSIMDEALPVLSPPEIITDPAAASVEQDALVVFDVTATGDEPLAYQWRENGAVLAGATNNTVTVGPVSPAQDGYEYDVVVSNPYGAVTSAVAVLTVTLSEDTLYHTGFEPAEGWATGSLGTNPGEQPPGGTWDNTGIAQVQDALPRTGDYSVYFNSENIGNHTALFTPTNAYSEYGAVTVSYYVYLPEYPNADGDSQVSADNNHRLELVTDATTLVLQWDNFDTAGNPGRQRTWIQSGLGAGGEPGVINQAWAPGEWTFVSFTLDFENDTYSYRVDSPTQGSNEVDGQPIDHDIGELQGVNLIHRDVGAALDLTMYVDDFSIRESAEAVRPALRFGPAPAADAILLEWDSSAGEAYRVEISPSLVFPDWDLLEEVTSTNDVTQWLYEIPEPDALGFIRLMEAE